MERPWQQGTVFTAATSSSRWPLCWWCSRGTEKAGRFDDESR